jgi:uncharacterized protein YbjT (DUF2867 family)
VPSTILVTGGSGTLGTRVVRRLAQTDRAVRVLSRQARDPRPNTTFVRGDLTTGEGIEAAVAGVDTVVHLASRRKGDGPDTATLLRAIEAEGGRPHLVFISIVGIDRVSFGYIRSKREAEAIVTACDLPWTMIRSTQFFDFTLAGLKQFTRLPVVPILSGFVVQPIDPDDVAARLAELSLGAPAGRVADIGGPEVTTWEAMTREYLRMSGQRRILLPIRIPGATFRAIRDGALVTGPEATLGQVTWREFLAQPPV